jgi:hypothetical protein
MNSKLQSAKTLQFVGSFFPECGFGYLRVQE